MRGLAQMRQVRRVRRLAAIGITLLSVAAMACGKSATSAAAAAQPTTTPAAAPTVSPTPAAQPSAVVVPPIDFETLIAVLPNAPAGWTRGRPKGNQGTEISTAEAIYELGDSLIHVEVIDTSFRPVYLAPLRFALVPGFSERSSGRYTKAAPVGGSPGFERWDEDAKSAEVTMVVANRIVVSAKGRNVDNANATRALVTAVDQKKLKDIK